MAEEIKVVISEVRQGDAVNEEMRRIQQLHQAADHYQKTGNTVAEKSARAEAYDLQKKQIGQALAREGAERAAGNTAAAAAAGREAQEMQRTLTLQTRLNMGYAEAAQLARTELSTREKELAVKAEEAALQRAGISSGSSGSSGLRGGRLGQLGNFLGSGLRNSGEAGFAVTIGLMLQQAINAQTEALRSVMAQTRDQEIQMDQDERHRNRALATVNGPAAEFSMEEGMTDQSAQLSKDVDDKQDQIDKLEAEKVQRAASWGVIGATVGGLAGTAFGNPILGAAVGGALGTGAGAAYNKLFINPQEDQIKGQQGMDAGEKGLIDKQREKLEAQRKADIQDEISMAEAEARFDVAGVRRIQEKITWLKRYREAKAEGANEGQAQELANLGTYEKRRQEVQSATSGMFTARTSAGEAASIARMSMKFMADGPGGHGDKIDAMHQTLKDGFRNLTETQRITDPNE